MSTKNKTTKKYKNTKVFGSSVTFYNEIHDAEDKIEYVVFAETYKEAEKKITKEAGDALVSIDAIYITEQHPIF